MNIHEHTGNFTYFNPKDQSEGGYQDTHPDNEDPLDQWKAEPTDGTIPSGYGIGDTEGQTKPEPVENKCH